MENDLSMLQEEIRGLKMQFAVLESRYNTIRTEFNIIQKKIDQQAGQVAQSIKKQQKQENENASILKRLGVLEKKKTPTFDQSFASIHDQQQKAEKMLYDMQKNMEVKLDTIRKSFEESMEKDKKTFQEQFVLHRQWIASLKDKIQNGR